VKKKKKPTKVVGKKRKEPHKKKGKYQRKKPREEPREKPKLSIGGKAFKLGGPPQKVSQFGNAQIKGCLMVTPPVPVPLDGLDEKNFKVDKKDGRNVPQLIKRLLDNLVENGTIEDYVDFYHKFVGSVKSPRSRALYLVWTVEGQGFDPTVDIWPVPTPSLKYFSLSKDSSPSVLKHHRGKEIREALLTNDRLKGEMKSIEAITERTMNKVLEEKDKHGYVPFFDLFHRGEGVLLNCKLPCMDARSAKGVSELTEENFKESSPAKSKPRAKPKAKPKAVEKPKATLAVRKKKTTPPSIRRGSDDKARANAVNGHFPSILGNCENSQGKLMKRVCKTEYMIPIPFTGSSNEEIVRNVENNWEDAFMLENGEDGNAILERGVTLVLNSRVDVGSYPPFDLKDGAPESLCKDFIAGTNPEIEGEGELFEDRIEDEDRIELVKSLLSAIAIPAASYDLSGGKQKDDSWYRAQAKDSISKSEVPIELILSSPDALLRFFERQLKDKDMTDMMANLYMQHKFVGMINGHICAH
jgi:hypothetical protein